MSPDPDSRTYFEQTTTNPSSLSPRSPPPSSYSQTTTLWAVNGQIPASLLPLLAPSFPHPGPRLPLSISGVVAQARPGQQPDHDYTCRGPGLVSSYTSPSLSPLTASWLAESWWGRCGQSWVSTGSSPAGGLRHRQPGAAGPQGPHAANNERHPGPPGGPSGPGRTAHRAE